MGLDPKMRAELYEGDKLADYVRALTRDVDDDALITRVIAGVRTAEDGQPARALAVVHRRRLPSCIADARRL